MLKFLHGYIDKFWQGLIKHGMIDDTSGLKFHQSSNTPDELRFNALAKKNGAVYQIIRECNRPFYLEPVFNFTTIFAKAYVNAIFWP